MKPTPKNYTTLNFRNYFSTFSKSSKHLQQSVEAWKYSQPVRMNLPLDKTQGLEVWLYNGSCYQAPEDRLDHSNGKHRDHEEEMVQALPE